MYPFRWHGAHLRGQSRFYPQISTLFVHLSILVANEKEKSSIGMHDASFLYAPEIVLGCSIYGDSCLNRRFSRRWQDILHHHMYHVQFLRGPHLLFAENKMKRKRRYGERRMLYLVWGGE